MRGFLTVQREFTSNDFFETNPHYDKPNSKLGCISKEFFFETGVFYNIKFAPLLQKPEGFSSSSN